VFFASVRVESWITKISSVLQAGKPVHKIHNSALTIHIVHLTTAYEGLKECAVNKEFCIYSRPAVSACNLLKQICNLTANLNK